MVPEYITKNIENIFVDIKTNIESEKKIYLENNNNELYIKYCNYKEAFNLIYNSFMHCIYNKYLFWESNMNHRICDYKYKKGTYAGLFCGRTIDIKCTDNNGRWRCSKHISTKYHEPKPLNVPIEERCISYIYNGKEKCKFRKKYDMYCKFHYSKINNIDLNNVEKYYKKELNKDNFKKEIKEIINKSVNINNLYDIVYNTKNKTYYDINEEIYLLGNIEINGLNNYIDHKFLEIKNNNIDCLLEPLIETINKNKKDNNIFMQKCKLIDKNIDIVKNDKRTDLDWFNSNIDNVHKVITKIINNKTYVNITYFEEKLINYNMKFKDFKKEVAEDFPKIYKLLKGYFEIMENIFDNDITRNINMAKIISVFI